MRNYKYGNGNGALAPSEDELDESLISDGLNQHSETQATEKSSHNYGSDSEENDLSLSEEKALAGYNEEVPELLEKEYRLRQEEEEPEAREASENPIVRLFTILSIGGTVIGAIGFLWLAFFSSSPPKQVVKKPTQPGTAIPTPDETSELKGRLAFQNQESQLAQPERQNRTKVIPGSDTSAKQPTPRAAPPQRTVTRTIVRQEPVSSPPPRPVYPSNRPQFRTPQARPVQPTVQSTAPVDPFEHWSTLAGLGQTLGVSPKDTVSSEQLPASSTESNESEQSIISNRPNPAVSSSSPLSPGITQDNQRPIQKVQIGGNNAYDAASSEPAGMTPGEVGILNQRSSATNVRQAKTVAVGTSATAVVTAPMLWDQSGEMADNGRFTATLTKDFRATDGSLALPSGTVFVVQTQSVNPGNNLVNMSVIGVVYQDSSGNIQQEQVPAGNLLVRGVKNRPILAKNLLNTRGEIVKQDLFVGVVASLGKIGEIINRPEQETIIQQNSSFSSAISTSRTSKTNILAAALEGFFDPMSKRLTTRSDQAVQELKKRPNVVVIPEGTQVSIFVNSFLTINR